MEKLTKKELIKELDLMNSNKFEYVGIMYNKSGDIQTVQNHKRFIQDLNLKPIREIEIHSNPSIREKNPLFIFIEFHSYVNIYRLKDIKDKFKKYSKEIFEGFSKERCVAILN